MLGINDGYELIVTIVDKGNAEDVIEVFLNHGYACDKVGIYDEVEDNFKNSIAYAEEHNFTELAELLKKHLKKSEN